MAMRVFVKCKVKPGLFDNEYLVAVNDSSAIVSSGNVNVAAPVTISGVDGSVRVYVVSESENGAVVELPGESVFGSLRTHIAKAAYA
jgi:hypothetical protein